MGDRLSQSAALENASREIRINAVCPVTIETPMVADMLAHEPDAIKAIVSDQPIGRVGRPEANSGTLLDFSFLRDHHTR
jgi:NAD(P)-dependent dehydrogenase (short-subunit alcohol dehydrogenase family)